MAYSSIAVRVLDGCRGLIRVPEARRVVRHVLAAEGVALGVEVEVTLADGATVRGLNRLYRGRDEETDVLSFAETDAAAGSRPAERGGRQDKVAFVEPPGAVASLGQVVLCAPYVRGHAAASGLPAQGSAAHLLVHGLLHLLGYDHEASEQDSERMRAREDELLDDLGYAGDYEHGH
jgi:probable rRNA maturation factor